MAKIRKYRIDPVKAAEGVWHTYTDPGEPEESQIRVKLARVSNPAFLEAQQKALRLRRDELRQRSTDEDPRLSSDDRREAVAPAVAEHIIRDWSNVEDDEGQEIPYSPGAAVEILLDPELVDFYEWILIQAGLNERFRRKADEAALGE